MPCHVLFCCPLLHHWIIFIILLEVWPHQYLITFWFWRERPQHCLGRSICLTFWIWTERLKTQTLPCKHFTIRSAALVSPHLHADLFELTPDFLLLGLDLPRHVSVNYLIVLVLFLQWLLHRHHRQSTLIFHEFAFNSVMVHPRVQKVVRKELNGIITISLILLSHYVQSCRKLRQLQLASGILFHQFVGYEVHFDGAQVVALGTPRSRRVVPMRRPCCQVLLLHPRVSVGAPLPLPELFSHRQCWFDSWLGSTLRASFEQVGPAVATASHVWELFGGEYWLYSIGNSEFVLYLLFSWLQWNWYVPFLLDPLPVGLVHPLPHVQRWRGLIWVGIQVLRLCILCDWSCIVDTSGLLDRQRLRTVLIDFILFLDWLFLGVLVELTDVV